MTPRVDQLELRELLSVTTGPTSVSSEVSYPLYDLSTLVSATSPPSGAYTPSEISSAYGFNKISFGSTKGDGTGETIAIVDAYDDPNIQADLNAFDAEFGIASTTVTRVNENGGTSVPSTDSTGGWELEESLDVEWAHAMAPGANIILVEASSSSDSDLLAGVNYASAHANVVSMSWGGSEFSSETSYDSDFSKSGVVFVASSGDNGAPDEWPAASSNILAVGGTSLSLSSSGTYSSESGWSGSGGGPSSYESQPSYQKGVVTQTTTKRANPDVSYDADPNTGFAVYDSFAYNRTTYGWIQIGGTSAGAPQWAALVAIADQGRALTGQAPLDSTSAQEVQSILYKNESAFHDVTTGTSTGSPHYSAATGYDYVTGLGSPYANLVVSALDGTSATASSDHLVISAPTSETAGSSFSVTVTADTAAGAVDTSYLGTIKFSSSDSLAGLPSSYTFTAADDGSHTFTVTLKTARTESVTATDTTTTAGTVTASGIVVKAAAASQFVVSSLSGTTVGTTQSMTVTAEDPYGNVATGYTGTVQLTSTDGQAAFSPSSYTFTTADGGIHTFSVAFNTTGSQSVTATDTTLGFSATTSGVAVSPAVPSGLTATAVSTTQINLSWTGSTGATGYTIQRSTNGSTGWSQVGTTAAGTTTYSDTGLSSGTTYYYRIQATGGAGSAYSGTASATTTGTNTVPTPTTTDTIWSSSYTPNENSYSYGSYEVGVKFSSTVAGTVTGVRFYKESWMGGYVHVGHLWSSTGVLLATATFTNETYSGWQQVSFSSPVAISANTTYTISFSTGGGYFGITSNSFRTATTSGPLVLPTNAGVYGNSGKFPTVSGSGMNFWADVAFSPTSTSSTTKSTPKTSTTGITVLTTPSTTQTTQTVATRNAVIVSGTYPYRGTVNQALSLYSSFSKRS